ncbi:hypothetical protein C0Q70_15828 [Pomacea canaliculata]|uniref:Methyltransferase FkbM domain-containing protein n=1 Tax=Pomacea canaliculata TaxID=400727 RepID=A0A2T7NVW9_POMCA|nr:uncharacterized protein LOC112571565 [Pomacea canaliculata]PVD25328.1 hypothetical protein C0Q70_15828 [Pomacea canaliculata]
MPRNIKTAIFAISYIIISVIILLINYHHLNRKENLMKQAQGDEKSNQKTGLGNKVTENIRLLPVASVETQPITTDNNSVLMSRDEKGWRRLNCGPSKLFRPISLSTDIGNLTFYGFLSAEYDRTVPERALKGRMFEKKEIESFLTLSRDLPLIDVGANVGLVALQAALQKRTVVAIEPIAANALRLCRSVLDFGHAGLVHVIQNAVSSREGHVTLATQAANTSTLFTVNEAGRQFTHDLTLAYAIKLDRILEMLPFRRAALKIDVESHEGHVLEGSRDLWKTLDVPLVWMEWQHVKGRATFGGQFVVDFMTARNFRPHHVISGKLLEGDFMSWPFTVLWRR